MSICNASLENIDIIGHRCFHFRTILSLYGFVTYLISLYLLYCYIRQTEETHISYQTIINFGNCHPGNWKSMFRKNFMTFLQKNFFFAYIISPLALYPIIRLEPFTRQDAKKINILFLEANEKKYFF